MESDDIRCTDLLASPVVTVAYFSAGVSSAVATKLMIHEIDRIMYTNIDDHHPDTMRFVQDCEAWFGKPVEKWQSQTRTVEQVMRRRRYIRNPKTGFATCTEELKQWVRRDFERANKGRLRIVWGYDCEETHRQQRILESMVEYQHCVPLIDRRITKAHAHEILKASGIRRPVMYEMGYQNNNCVGCVKGGMGYWNKIRQDFPEVYADRAKMERDIGFPILGRNTWLDELDPTRGRNEPPVCDECGLLCSAMGLNEANWRIYKPKKGKKK
jgi:hypothetical protein